MFRPIQVYLDSSDYSNFASHQDNPEISSIYDFLLHSVRAGHIEIRYSAIHISEAAGVNVQYQDAALARALAIESLSNNKCVLEPYAVWNAEMAQISSNSGAVSTVGVKEKIFRNDGIWFSDAISLDIPPIAELVQQAVSEALDAPRTISRTEFRKRFSLIYKKGKLTKTGTNLILNGSDNFPYFLDRSIVSDWLTGKLLHKQFCLHLSTQLCRPSVFIALTGGNPDHTATVKSLSSFLSANLIDAYKKLHYLLDEFRLCSTASNSLGLNSREIGKMSPEGVQAKIRDKLAMKLGIDASDNGLATFDFPSLDFISSVFANHLTQFISTYKDGSIPKRAKNPDASASDSGDILHLAYAPYFDLFRCDSYFADISRKSGAAHSTHIIPKLRELPNAISARLQAIESLGHQTQSAIK